MEAPVLLVNDDKQWEKWLQHILWIQRNNAVDDGWISLKVIEFDLPGLYVVL